MLYVPPELQQEARAMVANMRQTQALLEEMSQASLERLADKKARRSADRSRS